MQKNTSLFFILLVALLQSTACAQGTIPATRPAIENQAFDERLQELLNFTVPLIGVEELAHPDKNYLILDAREKKEYNISHIPGAKHFGYKKPQWKLLKNEAKDQPIVLYCSVGYRSEKMAEKFREEGFSEVYNLYGSIFEWANSGHALESASGQTTRQVHTYNKQWSQWVMDNRQLEKVW